MNLDEVVARLYAAPPEEFTAARGEAVAAARKAGDRDLARRIGGLRKPTVAAWLVNLLAHQRPDLVAELLTLGDQLRAAQRQLRGDDLRELSAHRRTMVTALAREARALAVAAGREVRAALPLDEVQNTLSAALADADVGEDVRLGRLVKAVEYAGFGEQPRPQLRLVQGGADDEPDEAYPDAPPDEPAAEPAPRRGQGATVTAIGSRRAQREPAHEPGHGHGHGPAHGPGQRGREPAHGPGQRGFGGSAPASGEAGAGESAPASGEAGAGEAARAGESASGRLRAERAAAREQAAERRQQRQAAHRELLAARTALAEAEAARTEAEKAVKAARRRVEKAKVKAESLADDS